MLETIADLHERFSDLGEGEIWALADEGDAAASYFLWTVFGENGDLNAPDRDLLVGMLKDSAAKGNHLAVSDLGLYLFYGSQGFEEDREGGLELLREAADMGYRNAIFNLGVIHEFELYDLERAFDYYLAGAELGDPDSMGNLSACYEDGKGTEPNAEEGRKWLMMAVENGNAVSQNYYATLLRDGEGGFERDLEGAREWFEEASETNADACFNLGLMHIDENPELAFEYYARGADMGHMECMNNLGILYKDGQGVERDLEAAFQWFKVSASLGNAMAAYNLARAYGNGEGTKANHTLYIDWLLASAEGGNPLAMHDLGVESESKGEYAEALGWYEAAGYLGYADSINNIGSLYYNGEVPAGDGEGIQLAKAGREKAFDYYVRAAELGSAEGHFNLASYYMSGHMVRRSIDMAKEHYQAAAEMGHAASMFNLAAMHANEFGDLDGFQLWVWKAADAGFQQAIDTIGKFGVPRPGEEPDGE